MIGFALFGALMTVTMVPAYSQTTVVLFDFGAGPTLPPAIAPMQPPPTIPLVHHCLRKAVASPTLPILMAVMKIVCL